MFFYYGLGFCIHFLTMTISSGTCYGRFAEFLYVSVKRYMRNRCDNFFVVKNPEIDKLLKSIHHVFSNLECLRTKVSLHISKPSQR